MPERILCYTSTRTRTVWILVNIITSLALEKRILLKRSHTSAGNISHNQQPDTYGLTPSSHRQKSQRTGDEQQTAYHVRAASESNIKNRSWQTQSFVCIRYVLLETLRTYDNMERASRREIERYSPIYRFWMGPLKSGSNSIAGPETHCDDMRWKLRSHRRTKHNYWTMYINLHFNCNSIHTRETICHPTGLD